MEITAEKLDYILPNVAGTASLQKFVVPLNKVFKDYQINTKLRASAFIAQVGHESGEFLYVKENLNYSAAGLVATFPKYFPNQKVADEYARQPVRIASHVYANRLGNGDEASQDGWKFRGRGLIQVTGRANYNACAQALGMTLEAVTDYLETTEGAVVSAAWFWNSHNLNILADKPDFIRITKIINGGTKGLSHRQLLYQRALQVL